jgi:Tfp pilus assembly protein PilF
MHHLLTSLALIIAGLFAGPMTSSYDPPQTMDDSEADEATMTEARDSLQRGNPAIAVTLLSRVTAQRPDHPLAWALLAEAHEALDQPDQAEAARERA